MDVDGIDAVFLYPTLGLFSGAVSDPQLAVAMCRAYNRWLVDYCKPYIGFLPTKPRGREWFGARQTLLY